MNNEEKGKWKDKLDPHRYEVMFEAGTEARFSGDLLKNKDNGVYTCGACGAELFSSKHKYDSKSGWPSFYDVMNNENVETSEDRSHGMNRIEVHCKNCGGHLGHVFDDGPKTTEEGDPATGKRYCINSISLDFKKDGESK